MCGQATLQVICIGIFPDSLQDGLTSLKGIKLKICSSGIQRQHNPVIIKNIHRLMLLNVREAI